jgi:PAS domain S-box-containing protein
MSESRDKLARFFTLCPDMLAIANTDGYFTCLNPAWSRTLGWSEAELLGRPYLDFVHPDDREATLREASDIATGYVTVSFDNRYQCRDGSYKWLQWTSVLIPETGEIYGSASDITALKSTEAALLAANQRTERATEAKNTFLSRMSHDLRTPLNAVMGFAQLLELDTLTADQRDSVQQILRGGRHLLQMINEVLDIARIESGRLSLSLEPVVLAEVLNEAVGLVGPLADDRAILVEVGDLHGLVVCADRQRLTQVLLNLLGNAVKYNRPQGRVSITASVNAGRVSVAVMDTGPGIPPEKLPRLFTPFERLGAEQSGIEGTGLGLALSRGLAEAMHGVIHASSVVGRGSVFTLDLPASTLPAVEVEPIAAPTPGSARVSGEVVYIEDNPSNVRLVERVLSQRPDVRLTHAPDGDTGLSLVRARRPGLVLLDLHLPDLPGEYVLRQLFLDSTTRGIPVGVLTADATPAQRRKLLMAGAVAYMTKPLDVAQVLALVDRYLAVTAPSPVPAPTT